MNEFDYKKYSMNKLEEWILDLLNANDVTANEIRDLIWQCLDSQIDYHNQNLQKALQLKKMLFADVESRHVTSIEYNEQTREYYITIPNALLHSLAWKENDVLEWDTDANGFILLRKV